MLKRYLAVLTTALFLSFHPLRASVINQTSYLKAVILERKIYLMDNGGNLVISNIENLEIKKSSISEIIPHLPIIGYPTMSNPTDTHLFWDVGSQGLYVTQQSDIPFTTMPIIKLPLAATVISTDELKYNTTDIAIDFGVFELALAMKRVQIPFFASLYVTPNMTRQIWISQDNSFTKWVCVPPISSLPKDNGLSLVPQPEEHTLNAYIHLPYIAFNNEGMTYLVDVNGKVYEFSDNQFVEGRFFKHERILSSPH